MDHLYKKKPIIRIVSWLGMLLRMDSRLLEIGEPFPSSYLCSFEDANEVLVCSRVGCISGVSAQQMFLGGQDKAWRVFPS